jgi:Fe(3+) dicitrate transport protein
VETQDAETSWNAELGVRTQHWLRWQGSVTAFFSDYDNLTSQCTLTAGCQDIDRAFNTGHVQVGGVELGLGAAPRAGAWSFPVDGTFTWTQSTFLDAFVSADPQLGEVEKGDELPYVPEYVASLAWGASHRLGAFYLQANYQGEMREEASQGAEGRRNDTQFLLDARIQAHPTDKVTVFVRGENLLDQRSLISRRPFGARPGRPFTAQVGAEVRF